MDTNEKPPGKKSAPKENGPEKTDGKRPGERQPPAGAERTEDELADRDRQAMERNETQRSQPVTNQDEQNKITNAENSDVPVSE